MSDASSGKSEFLSQQLRGTLRQRVALSCGCLSEGLGHGTVYVVLGHAISTPTFLQVISEDGLAWSPMRTSNDHRFTVGVP